MFHDDHRPRRRLNRSVEVQEAVKKIILQRRLAAGDPLPTEAELMDELGIGRNSVREALKVLEAVGIVDIRHGFGTFVGRMSLSGLVDELAFHTRLSLRVSLGHLIELRELLESGLVHRLIDFRCARAIEDPAVEYPALADPALADPALADPALANPALEVPALEASALKERALEASALKERALEARALKERSLEDVAGVIAQMEAEAMVGDVSPETDRLFHDVLYRPLGNPLVGQLLGAFWDVFFQLRDDLGTPDESPEDMVRKHRAIYDAVIGGDKLAASEAMRAHFDGVRFRLERLGRSLEDIPRPT